MADEPEDRTRIDQPNRPDEPEPRARFESPDRREEPEAQTRIERSDRDNEPGPQTRIERSDRGNEPGPQTRIDRPGRPDEPEPRPRIERSARRDEPEPRTRIDHPNRRKPASKVTRLLVVLLLLVSAGLMIIVTLGGWSTLEGAKPVQIAYILVYILLAFFVARWSRGVLPLIAALAIVLGIFAIVSVPGWYDRDQPGFTDPGLPSDVLGLVTALIVPVQLLLIAVSLSGFRQAWNVEIERHVDDDRPREPRAGRGGSGPSPAPA